MREGVHGACPCACVGVKGPLCGVSESQGSHPSHQAFIASDIKLLSVFPVSVMDSHVYCHALPSRQARDPA